MAITERFWSKMTRVVQENGFHLDLNEIKDRKNAHNEDVDLNSFFVM